jgi:hypothetical protein
MSANLTIPNVLTPNELGSIICDRVFDGETLAEICRDAAMPDKPTVTRWLAQYPEFLDEYVFTGQLLAEALAADAVSMADNADTESRKRIRGAKIRRLCLAVRRWVADWLIRKILPRALLNRKEMSCVKQ